MHGFHSLVNNWQKLLMRNRRGEHALAVYPSRRIKSSIQNWWIGLMNEDCIRVNDGICYRSCLSNAYDETKYRPATTQRKRTFSSERIMLRFHNISPMHPQRVTQTVGGIFRKAEKRCSIETRPKPTRALICSYDTKVSPSESMQLNTWWLKCRARQE